jgi:hypothetical protein
MRRLAASTPLLVAAVVLAVLWVTNAGSVPFFSGGPGDGERKPEGPVKSQLGNQVPPSLHKHPVELGFFLILSYLALGAFLLVLLAFLASATVTNRRGRRAQLVEAAEVVGAVDALAIPADLVRTTERQLQAIRQGTPRNAIVACWWELERSSEATGLPRAASETSSEFTARVLSRYRVQPSTIEGLAALYREARFSLHDMTEADRERAVAALEQVLADFHTSRSMSASVVER